VNHSLLLRTALLFGTTSLALGACADDTSDAIDDETADTGFTEDAGATGDAGATDSGSTDTAGTDAGGTDAGDAAPTYYEVVKPILDAHCAGCHVEGGVGPFPMTTYAEVQAMAPAIADSIARGSMPPWDAEPVAEYLYDPSLSDAQIEAVLAWADGGALEGDPAAEGPAVNLELGSLSRVDVTVGLASPYTPETRPDEYRCFVLDWPYEEPTWITGFRADPSALSIAHHAIAWYVPAGFAEVVDAAEGADGRPGYDCFGSAAPTGADDFPAGIFGAWAPGTDGFDYPEGTGQRMNPDDRIVLQMHYSLAAGGDVADQATVSFSTSDDVALRAGSVAHFNFQWFVDGDSMAIPAGEANVMHEHSAPLVGSPLVAAMMPEVDTDNGLRIYGVIPHLHQIGTSLTLEVERPDGTIEPIVDIAEWDFNWQRQYFLAEPIDLTAEDRVNLRCTWDNSPGNQPVYNGAVREPLDLGWGDGSFDEMCLGLFFVSEVPAD